MDKEFNICVIGFGYLGLPLPRLFSTRYPMLGFDMNVSCVLEPDNIESDLYHTVNQKDSLSEVSHNPAIQLNCPKLKNSHLIQSA